MNTDEPRRPVLARLLPHFELRRTIPRSGPVDGIALHQYVDLIRCLGQLEQHFFAAARERHADDSIAGPEQQLTPFEPEVMTGTVSDDARAPRRRCDVDGANATPGLPSL